MRAKLNKTCCNFSSDTIIDFFGPYHTCCLKNSTSLKLSDKHYRTFWQTCCNFFFFWKKLYFRTWNSDLDLQVSFASLEEKHTNHHGKWTKPWSKFLINLPNVFFHFFFNMKIGKFILYLFSFSLCSWWWIMTCTRGGSTPITFFRGKVQIIFNWSRNCSIVMMRSSIQQRIHWKSNHIWKVNPKNVLYFKYFF